MKIPDPKDKDSFPDCLILLRSWTVGYARERSRRGDSAVRHSHHWHASSLVARFQSVISSCIGRPPCHDERSSGPLRRQQTSTRGRRGLQKYVQTGPGARVGALAATLKATRLSVPTPPWRPRAINRIPLGDHLRNLGRCRACQRN